MSAVTEETFLQKRLRLKAEREADTRAQQPTPFAPPRPGMTVVTDITDRGHRWIAVKLDAQLQDLATMGPDSGRNDKLNAIAYSAGRFIPKWLDENDVARRLYDAAQQSGLEHGESIATIKSGMSKGMLEPRDPPIEADDGTGGLASLVAGPVHTILAPSVEPGLAADTPDTQQESTWVPLDLSPYLDGSYTPPVPLMLTRSDQQSLIYPNRVHWLSGEPEALKSWLALLAVAQVLLRGERAVYLDLEDGPAGVVARLLAMGVPADLLLSQFLYLSPHEPLSYLKRAALEPVIAGASLLVIDACTESLALQQLSPKDDVDIASWLALLPRWAVRQGLAVLVLDHVVKDTENRGRWATGSQHKLAGLDGVAFLLEAVQPGGVGMRGRSRLYVAKDRHGQVRPHAIPVNGGKQWIGDLIVDSTTGGFTDVALDPPAAVTDTADSNPTEYAERISQVMAKLDRPLSTKEIEDRVKGRAADKRSAVAWLIDEGYVAVEHGPRGAKLHSLITPFPPSEEP